MIIPARPGAGLRIEFRHEFDCDAFGRFESLRRQADGSYRLPPGRPRVPLIFPVRASLDRSWSWGRAAEMLNERRGGPETVRYPGGGRALLRLLRA